MKSSHRLCRWRGTGTAILLFIAGSALVAHGQGSTPSEYQLKAAFLFNFAKFIEWPQSAFANPQSPFVICVFGKDPFGSSLDEALANKTVGDRPISILRTKDKMELKRCHIVFVSHPETEHISEIVGALQGSNVLLVGESDGFAESGGMIEFTLEQGRVRFSINPDTAEHANLRFSSKLLALAKIVHGATRAGGG